MSGTGTYLDVLPGGIAEVEESDVQLASDKRTKPLYPTPPDDLERLYAKVREYKELKRAEKVAKELGMDAQESRPFIAHPPVDLPDPTKAPGKPGAIAKRLLAQGWEVTIRTNRALVPAVRFVDASEEGAEDPHEAGDIRYPAHALRTYAMYAVKRATNGVIGIRLKATWTRRAKSLVFEGAETTDPWLGWAWRGKMLTARPQNTIEAEEGIVPPIPLDEWLHLVAPTKESKALREKRKAKAAAEAAAAAEARSADAAAGIWSAE